MTAIAISLVLSAEPIYIYGFASWYGKEFEGRKTANGEVFDSSKFTAAHKTLPLGTLIEVENLKNGRKVIVKVNDRGPFVKGRILDLSRAAAEKLGYIHEGVAYVRFRIVSGPKRDNTSAKSQNANSTSQNTAPLLNSKISKTNSYPFILDEEDVVNSSSDDESNATTNADYTLKPPKYYEAEGEYAIQIGAFIVEKNAHKLVENLKSAGFSHIYTTILSTNGKNFIRVRIGDFSTREQAEETLENLRNKGFNGFILSLRKEA